MLSSDKLSKKPLLFKSFKGLQVKQFDDIYQEMESKYTKHEIKRLSHRKYRRERSLGAGRHFKMDIKDRVIDIKDRVIMVFGVLQTLHHIHPNRLSIRPGPE